MLSRLFSQNNEYNVTEALGAVSGGTMCGILALPVASKHNEHRITLG